MLVLARRIGGAFALALAVLLVIVAVMTIVGDVDRLQKFMQQYSPLPWVSLAVVMYPVSVHIFRH